jgi:hypothetical protein
MPGCYDRLHSGEAGRQGGDDGGSSIVAMHYVRARAPKRFVQAAHQLKKRARMMQNNFKTFGPELFAKLAKPIKAVDGRNVAAIAL